MLAELTIDTFKRHAGSVFEVTVQGYDELLTLVEVRPAKHSLPGLARQPFSLLLAGRRTDLVINPGTAVLRHKVLGELLLEIAPLGRRPDGTFEYQIGFN